LRQPVHSSGAGNAFTTMDVPPPRRLTRRVSDPGDPPAVTKCREAAGPLTFAMAQKGFKTGDDEPRGEIWRKERDREGEGGGGWDVLAVNHGTASIEGVEGEAGPRRMRQVVPVCTLWKETRAAGKEHAGGAGPQRWLRGYDLLTVGHPGRRARIGTCSTTGAESAAPALTPRQPCSTRPSHPAWWFSQNLSHTTGGRSASPAGTSGRV